jgi:5-formyltetrahydrofolate cyclo-ligase
MSATELDYLSSRISRQVIGLPEVKNAKTISVYLHKGSEVRTDEIVAWCLSSGKRVIIPVTNRENRKLIFSELHNPATELHIGSFGILEPKPEFLRPIPLEEAEVVLVPGIAWDFQGHRVGYGGGYYDRSINSLRKHVLTIGLAYELQLVKQVPASRYDRAANKVVTERRVITTQSFA